MPARDIKELIALAKAKPGSLNFGSAGPASLAHLASALFATLSGIELTHVPYKSTAQSVIDLIAGRIEMQFATIAPSLANIRAGQLRALAVTGRKRSDALPDVPPVPELDDVDNSALPCVMRSSTGPLPKSVTVPGLM